MHTPKPVRAAVLEKPSVQELNKTSAKKVRNVQSRLDISFKRANSSMQSKGHKRLVPTLDGRSALEPEPMKEAKKHEELPSIEQAVHDRQQGNASKVHPELQQVDASEKRFQFAAALRESKRREALANSRRKIRESLHKQDVHDTKISLYQYMQEQLVEREGLHIPSTDHDPYEDQSLDTPIESSQGDRIDSLHGRIQGATNANNMRDMTHPGKQKMKEEDIDSHADRRLDREDRSKKPLVEDRPPQGGARRNRYDDDRDRNSTLNGIAPTETLINGDHKIINTGAASNQRSQFSEGGAEHLRTTRETPAGRQDGERARNAHYGPGDGTEQAFSGQRDQAAIRMQRRPRRGQSRRRR